MRAAFYATTGPARDVLSVREVDRPEPAPGQVRVRMRLSGVNPTDVKTRDGSTARAIDTGPPPHGRIPHLDGVGEIDAVGDGVDVDRVGQRVWVYLAAAGRPWGTAAQWCVVPEAQAVGLPAAASDELGASLGVPAMTAYHCLFAAGPPTGETVLVAGGAGAVGHYAIELARWAGATVVATVSGPEKAELARAAGADLVVNYRDADAAEQILVFAPHIDRVIEVALGANLDLDLAVARPGAEIVIYAVAGDDPTLPVRRCMTANIALRFVLLYGVGTVALQTAARQVTAAARGGALTELPAHRFALDDVAAAHEAVEAGVTGKVLVEID